MAVRGRSFVVVVDGKSTWSCETKRLALSMYRAVVRNLALPAYHAYRKRPGPVCQGQSGQVSRMFPPFDLTPL